MVLGAGRAVAQTGIPIAHPTELAAWKKIDAALASKTNVKMNNKTLLEIREMIEKAHGIPVRIDIVALDDIGRSADTKVTDASSESVSLRSALKHALNPFDLGFTKENESLLITSLEESESRVETLIYRVGDLAAPRNTIVHVFDDSGPYSQLKDIIQSTVQPETWDDVGGPGSIMPLDHAGLLFISQMDDVHRDIEGLLASLRRALADDKAGVKAAKKVPQGGQVVKVYHVVRALTPEEQKTVNEYPRKLQDARKCRVAAMTKTKHMFWSLNDLGALDRFSNAWKERVRRALPPEELASAIKATIEPASWRGAGAQGGVFATETRLIVRQTPAMHLKVRAFLDQLGVLQPRNWEYPSDDDKFTPPSPATEKPSTTDPFGNKR